ncbi:MAG: hypothetical protein ABSD31_07395 [Candidatus Binataceae bacterium]
MTWARIPQAGCPNGQLVKFADITGSGLIENPHSRYETRTHYPLNLKRQQYIGSVLYQGAITLTPLDHLVSDLTACPAAATYVTDATDSNCTSGHAPVGGGDNACIVQCVDGAWLFDGDQAGLGGLGNFCMYYYYNDPSLGEVYTPFGCLATANSQTEQPATSVFTPDMPVPPATPNQVYILGASTANLAPMSTYDISGTLTVWLCLQTASATGN